MKEKKKKIETTYAKYNIRICYAGHAVINIRNLH